MLELACNSQGILMQKICAIKLRSVGDKLERDNDPDRVVKPTIKCLAVGDNDTLTGEDSRLY